MDDLEAQISGLGSLAEPVRRTLYEFVVSQPDPVSRDQAAEGVGVPRHTAKFHLDRLVDEGLLEPEFRHLTERRGPGSGRPAKLYRRSPHELSVNLPERHYELAGQLMAQAIETAHQSSEPVVDALQRTAAEAGRRVGDQAAEQFASGSNRAAARVGIRATLAAQGYEPRLDHSHVRLANCPFHHLAREHTALVCGMNLAFVDALVSRAAPGAFSVRLDPDESRCCVVLDEVQ